MNPLTLVKRTQAITSKEASLGISEEASWHAKYKDSAYIFVGGIPFDLTEGDLLAVFAQYGEIVDVNLVRDKATGKSRGFAFVAYEDQRSTTLAVDNLNGAKVLGRIVRVDHVSKYKKKEEEDEETQRKKREARGVCRAFQKGECTRGDSCKFSHDEQRAANTGWGPKESNEIGKHDRNNVCWAFQKGECNRGDSCKFSHDEQRAAANTGRGPKESNQMWEHDRNTDPPRSHKNFSQNTIDQRLPDRAKDKESKSRSINRDGRSSRSEAYEDRRDTSKRESDGSFIRDRDERLPDRSRRGERKSRDDGYTQAREERSEKGKSNRYDAKRPRHDTDDDDDEAEERYRKSHR